jgi:hypothetical protein
VSAEQRDLRGLFAEEREAAAQPTADAYRTLLEQRLVERPIRLDLGFFEQVLANRPWADELRPLAARLIGYPATPPDTVVLVNTFPRVPTAAAETVLVESLGLRRGSIYPGNSSGEAGFDLGVGVRELRSRSLVRAHLIASVRFRACLAALAVRPIVLVRDIFDTIASYADDRSDPVIAPGYRRAALEPQARQRILVLRMAAQLVDFYGTWSIEQSAGRCVVYRWEDVREDWPGFLVVPPSAGTNCCRKSSPSGTPNVLRTPTARPVAANHCRTTTKPWCVRSTLNIRTSISAPSILKRPPPAECLTCRARSETPAMHALPHGHCGQGRASRLALVM